MKFNELDVVRTLKDFPENGISKGEIGTIVMCFVNPNEAYEVEFTDKDGATKTMFAILPDDLEKVNLH